MTLRACSFDEVDPALLVAYATWSGRPRVKELEAKAVNEPREARRCRNAARATFNGPPRPGQLDLDDLGEDAWRRIGPAHDHDAGADRMDSHPGHRKVAADDGGTRPVLPRSPNVEVPQPASRTS